MTDPSGFSIEPAVYTAFGERVAGSVDGPADRYGYAGAWGYQSHQEFPFLHVGARYYEPATGRFLQRDPIGLAGGANVYVYVRNRPISYLDSAGLKPCPKCGHDPDDDIGISIGPVSITWGGFKRRVRNGASCFRQGYYHGWFDRYIRTPIDDAVDGVIDFLFPPDPWPVPPPPPLPAPRPTNLGDYPPPPPDGTPT